MRIKPEIRERLEKVFLDAGFKARIDFDAYTKPIYAAGSGIPISSNAEYTLTAKMRIPESWMELEG